jgi:aryl sulfotransferase
MRCATPALHLPRELNLTLIDSGLFTHDEAEGFRPRIYEELASGLWDDAIDAASGPAAVRFAKVHDAYTLTQAGEPLLAGSRGAQGAIVIVRDPRDVACSLANHNNSGIDDAIAFMANKNAGFSINPKRQDRQLRHGFSIGAATLRLGSGSRIFPFMRCATRTCRSRRWEL